MIEHIKLPLEEPVIALTPEITYLQKPYWCGSTMQTLNISLLRPRQYYEYDPKCDPRPCIIFLCGGAFQKQDRNVWLPELVYFAKRGYIVATVDYSTFAFTRFPEPLIEIKAAIRYLRAHAEEFCIDPRCIAAMGESAGGQFAGWLASTGDDPTYHIGDNLDQSDAVQCCAAWYPVTNVNAFPKPETLRIFMDDFPDTCDLVSPKTAPTFLMHGLNDQQVPYSQSIRLHDKLAENNVDCELLLVDDADHSDPRFINEILKDRTCAFLDKYLK